MNASSDKPRKDWEPKSKKSEDKEAKPGDGAPNAPFDEARFNAGVVKLYEALLKEPIPEEMLRLVDRLGKQERKS